ncbi:MAG: cyclic nucleotide-binding domain-containing protein [Methylacidiphilales bacterium]|nr:cyclic nucleotide-binding domain-containing protein [Candidatus Methylacidiphilales bacterium]
MADQPESQEEASFPETPPGTEWQEIPPALPALGILAGLSDQSLVTLAPYGRYQQLPAGTMLITEGEPQDCFYVVVSGRLDISAFVAGKNVPLSIAEAGECLGEVSVLDPGSASANVQVREDAVLWSMNLENLRVYLSEHIGGGGALLMGMAQCLSRRIRQANLLISRHHTVPVEPLPRGQSRAITAENTPVNLGFFDRLKKSMAGEKKVKIPTEIKL